MGNKIETMLIYVDTINNNNKFYHVVLDGDMVTKRWGRVGQTGTLSTESTGRYGYDKIIAAKQKKGYKVTAVNAKHVTTTASNGNGNLESVAQKHLSSDPTNVDVTKLISRLVMANKHHIMEQSGGQISVSDDGLVKTALGIVNQNTINEARRYLNSLIRVASASPTNPTHSQISDLESYLTLIPQNVGLRRGWHEDYLTSGNLVKQSAFLDQLETSVQWYDKTQAVAAQAAVTNDDDKADYSDLFRMRLNKLDNKSAEFKRIEKLYLKTRSNMHSTRNLKLINVFTVEDMKNKDKFDKAVKDYGNVKELWHGTSVANVLSILTKGLFVPTRSQGIAIAGRMFGDAIYLSDIASKSAGYTTGFWTGGGRQSNNCFMFLNDVVMGNEFRPTHWDYTQEHKAYKGTDSRGKKYNSINVKGGTCRVINNEMMVWDTDQINMKYLCEFAE